MRDICWITNNNYTYKKSIQFYLRRVLVSGESFFFVLGKMDSMLAVQGKGSDVNLRQKKDSLSKAVSISSVVMVV